MTSIEERRALWDSVLLGYDPAVLEMLELEGLLVDADEWLARHVFRGFGPADQLLERWRTVVDGYNSNAGFDEDALMSLAEPYLDQVRRLADRVGLIDLVTMADSARIRVDRDRRYSPGEGTRLWLELVDDLLETVRGESPTELEDRSLRTVLRGVAYLDELVLYLAKPIEPVPIFDPDLFFPLWNANATISMDEDAVWISARVQPANTSDS